MQRTPELNRLRHLFAGADDGHYTLPEPIEAGRRTLGTLAGVMVARDTGNEQAIADMLLKAAEGGKLPTNWQSQIKPQSAAAERMNAASAVLFIARETAADRLLAAVYDHADDIIVDHLRPALEDAVAAIRPHAQKAVDLPWGVPTRLFAPEYVPVVDALGKAAANYGAVRRAQSLLQEVTREPSGDAFVMFGEFRSGIRAHWPTFRTQFQSRAPWSKDDGTPLEGPARFAWLVANAADDLWLPDVDECERAFRKLVAKGALQQAGMPA